MSGTRRAPLTQPDVHRFSVSTLTRSASKGCDSRQLTRGSATELVPCAKRKRRAQCPRPHGLRLTEQPSRTRNHDVVKRGLPVHDSTRRKTTIHSSSVATAPLPVETTFVTVPFSVTALVFSPEKIFPDNAIAVVDSRIRPPALRSSSRRTILSSPT